MAPGAEDPKAVGSDQKIGGSDGFGSASIRAVCFRTNNARMMGVATTPLRQDCGCHESWNIRELVAAKEHDPNQGIGASPRESGRG
jgi:hypothetical protein